MMQIVPGNFDKFSASDWGDLMDYCGSVFWAMFNVFLILGADRSLVRVFSAAASHGLPRRKQAKVDLKTKCLNRQPRIILIYLNYTYMQNLTNKNQDPRNLCGIRPLNLQIYYLVQANTLTQDSH